MKADLPKTTKFARRALPAALAMIFGHAGAAGINGAPGVDTAKLPTAGVATNPANVSVTSLDANAMTLAITGRAIINWSTFNIGSTNSLTFTGAGGAVLNRVQEVNASNSSTIAGNLTGNNMAVMLMNPNGIAFTSTAVVNVGALVATTGTIDQNTFLSTGNAVITGATGGRITIDQLARITASGKQFTASNAGLVALVAPEVINQGVITAVGGRILLAGAQAATISMNNGLYEFTIGAGVERSKVENKGTLTTADSTETGLAAAGTIVLSAPEVEGFVSGAINLSGIQRANRIEVNGNVVELKSDLDATTVVGSSKTVNVCGCSADLQDAVDIAAAGATVNLAAGTYTRDKTLNVNKSITFKGAGKEGDNRTLIDTREVTAAKGGYGIMVTADDVLLSDFILWGPTATTSSAYGIKVQPAPLGATPGSRVKNFHIRNVISQGAGRAELDLNGVQGATIEYFTANGAPVSGVGATTPGAGIQITDSSGVTITHSTTMNNEWGGVALFQANKPGNFNQQTTDITIAATATGNDFQEPNPLYLQDESASKDFGTLNLQGFAYAVRNPTTFVSGPNTVVQSQFTWMQKSAQQAFNFAVSLGNPASSYAQAWNGTGVTQSFAVGVGLPVTGGAARAMSIQTAVDHASAGAQIDIYPGRYVESVVNRTAQGVHVNAAGLFVDKDGLTLRGVDSDGHAITRADDVQAWITAGARSDFGMAHGVVANNVTFEGLGFKPKTDYLNKTIEISGDNFTFANSVVDNRFESAPGGTQAGGAAALYFGELDPAGHQITKLTVTGSRFLDGSIVVTEGVGASADGTTFQPAADRVISNNVFIGSDNYSFGAVLLNGYMEEINWRTKPIGAVTLTGNRFSGFDDSVMMRGDQQGVDLRQVMSDNTFDRSVLVTDAGGNVRGEEYASTMGGAHDPIRMRDKYSIQSSIQAGIARSAAGDTVNVGPEATAESVVLNSARNLSFNGSTIGSLTINAAGAGIGGRVTASGAGGFLFNRLVVLLGDTSLATTGANIAFNGDIQSLGGAAYALSLNAGAGDVTMVSGGSSGNPLGRLEVDANNFTLLSTLWVSGYDINALGTVALSDHTLRSVGAGVTNEISAGGNVTGSTISEGSVHVDSDGSVSLHVETQAPVEIHAEGPANISGSAPSMLIDAPSGSVSGDFGQVTNIGGGLIEVNGKPQANSSFTEGANNNRVVPAEVTTAASREASGPSGGVRRRRKPEDALDMLENGEAIEIDLTPG